MRMFAHHPVDTPRGESHAPISISVLMTFLFVGALWVVFVLAAVTSRVEDSIFTGANPFTIGSLVIAVLLLVFLSVDLRRNRVEARGGNRHQWIVFGVAGVLLAMLMIFLVRVIRFTGPPA